MLQGTLFVPAADWRAPKGSDLPPDWNQFQRIGLDTETCDPLLKKLGLGVRRGGYLAGISFAVSEDRGWYLPLRHLGGDNVEDPALALGYIRHQAKRFRGKIVGAKLSYDLDYLAEAGIHFPLAEFEDVQVAEPLLDENQYSYSLDNILKRYDLPMKDETLLREAALQYRLDPKADLHKLPARYVGPYAIADAQRPLALIQRQLELIEEQGLTRIWRLEQQVLPVLVKMRRRGVRVDFDHLDRVERWAKAEEVKAWGELLKATGVSIPFGAAMEAERVSKAFIAVGVQVPSTAKGKPSITKEWLATLDHPAGAIVRRARKMSQLRTTFVNAVRQHAIGDRIHTTFNQVVMQEDDGGETEGARPGRLSCQDPNLQQQPGDKDAEIGPFWRETYIPEEGAEWCSADYSQQEPRGALHFALISGPRLIGQQAYDKAMEACRRYREDPTTDAHDMFTRLVYGDAVVESWDKVTYKTNRSHMKNIFLGICYAMGGPKLCRQLGLPTAFKELRDGRRIEVAGPEGQALLDKVDRNVPFIRRTAEKVEAAAKSKGYIITAGGRHCHFTKDAAGNYDWTHKAFNRAIQGSAADQTKRAMVDLDREGIYLQLQVHDEFSMSLSDRSQGARIAEIMENCMPELLVPSKVDVEFGKSWGDSMLPPDAERWWRKAA